MIKIIWNLAFDFPIKYVSDVIADYHSFPSPFGYKLR